MYRASRSFEVPICGKYFAGSDCLTLKFPTLTSVQHLGVFNTSPRADEPSRPSSLDSIVILVICE